MILALSTLQASLDAWFIAMVGLLVVWIWQVMVRREAPPVLSIKPEGLNLQEQRVFIQRVERLRRYVIAFVTISVILGITSAIEWLYQHLQ